MCENGLFVSFRNTLEVLAMQLDLLTLGLINYYYQEIPQRKSK